MHRLFASLRWRLLLGTALWVLASLLVVGTVVWYVFKEQAESQLRSELSVHLNQLSAALEWQEAADDVDAEGAEDGLFLASQVQLSGRLSEPRFEQPLSGWYWQVSLPATGSQEGQQTPQSHYVSALQSDSLWDESLPILPMRGIQQWWTGVRFIDDEPLYVLQQRLRLADEGAPELLLTMAAHETVVQGPMARFTTLLVIAFGLMALGILAAAAVQFRAAMSPLQRLVKQLRAIEKGEKAQLEGDFPSEITPLTTAFNNVLGTNAVVLEWARAQAGNLAHAMKTPMTVLSNAAEQDNSALGALVREQVGQAQQQLNVHLARARAVAQVKTFGVRTHVPTVIDSIQRVCQRLYADKNLHWQVDLHSDDFYFTGEAHDLQEIVGNLFDNACKWAQGKIQVRTRAIKAPKGRLQWELICADDGPGIATEQLNHILGRGVRGDEGTTGSGLGLAIVSDLIAVYEGQLQMQRSALGGLQVRVQLG